MADNDRAALIAELERLEEEERERSVTRRSLHDRIDRVFPNESLLAEEKRVSAARRELHDRIDVLRARIEFS